MKTYRKRYSVLTGDPHAGGYFLNIYKVGTHTHPSYYGTISYCIIQHTFAHTHIYKHTCTQDEKCTNLKGRIALDTCTEVKTVSHTLTPSPITPSPSTPSHPHLSPRTPGTRPTGSTSSLTMRRCSILWRPTARRRWRNGRRLSTEPSLEMWRKVTDLVSNPSLSLSLPLSWRRFTQLIIYL